MPFLRRHFAKKEATEHMAAQNALARGDMKEWHKHEGKAHRAGAHAHHGGLMHTDYMMAKENLPPVIVPRDERPIVVNEFPPTVVPTMVHTMSQGSISPFLQPLPPIPGPIEIMEESMPANTIVETGDEMEPTVIVEYGVEEARTVVEYGAPIAAITRMEGMMASMSMQEQVQYGEPQWVGQTVTGY
jgi:hypothetical protein